MIPTRLLIHTCEATRKGETDRDGNITGENYILSMCRVDIVKGQIINEAGYTRADSLTLFYDVLNSKSEPAGYAPKIDDRILFNNKSYTIKTVRELYTQGKNGAHHYEAGLV